MKCPLCRGTTSSLGGRSAHLHNMYCDDDNVKTGCGWEAWNVCTHKPRVVKDKQLISDHQLKFILKPGQHCQRLTQRKEHVFA